MVRPLVLACSLFVAGQAAAVNVVIDDTFDTGGFFAPGSQARATVEAAADFFSEILLDSLDPVTTPEPIVSSRGGVYSWTWFTEFDHPSESGMVELVDVGFAADEYRIYVGAEAMGPTQLAVGGYSTAGKSVDNGGNGQYTNAEINTINAINAEFFDASQVRGKPSSEFANWGGYLSMNTAIDWHDDFTTEVPAGKNDLFSVALHELGHAFGFGIAPSFLGRVTGTFFTGPASAAANGGPFPRVTSDGGHWTDGTDSTVLGTAVTQETLMDPTITVGERKLWTTLDAAGLADTGWDVLDVLPGDYNGDGRVDASDYTVWRDARDGPGPPNGKYSVWSVYYGASEASAATSVPEPTAAALLLLGLVASRKRR